jgi:hypothetical protein
LANANSIADADADQERRVDQAGEQEHAALEHRDQFRLAGGRFEELRTHDADAEGGAEGTQADDDADGDGGEPWTLAMNSMVDLRMTILLEL